MGLLLAYNGLEALGNESEMSRTAHLSKKTEPKQAKTTSFFTFVSLLELVLETFREELEGMLLRSFLLPRLSALIQVLHGFKALLIMGCHHCRAAMRTSKGSELYYLEDHWYYFFSIRK